MMNKLEETDKEFTDRFLEELEKLTEGLIDGNCETLALHVKGGSWVWYSDRYKGSSYNPSNMK